MHSYDLSKIFSKLRYQRNIFELSKGLMFKKNISGSQEVYIFCLKKERNAAITMLFVFFPIDVLWLNSKFEIIDMKENVNPFSLYVRHKGKAKYFIEMPSESIKKYGMKVGDRILFPI